MSNSSALISAPCRHCGLEANGADFCCAGCETAWTIIHSGGWDAYYEVRDQQTAKPVEREGDDFQYLGSDAFKETHVVADGEFLSTTFYLNGMRCPACAWLVEKAAVYQGGVREAVVRFSDGRLDLVFSQDTNLVLLAETLADLGYRLGLNPGNTSDDSSELVRMGISGALAANLMLMSMPFYIGLEEGSAGPLFAWIAFALSLPTLGYGARPFFLHAWTAIKARAVSLDLPIVVGLCGAFILSTVNLFRGNYHGIFYDSMGMLVFFLLLGRYLQGMGVRRALGDGRKLLAEMPRLVFVMDAQGGRQIPAEEVQKGDHLILPTGHLIPVDGTLLSGTAVLNCHVVTGEAHPVEQKCGDTILAGSINMGAQMEMRATGGFSDTRTARMERIARGLRGARNDARSTRLAAVFMTTVTTLALIGAVAWWSTGPYEAFSVALTLLIVACPCALALAEPTSSALAWSRAARAGVQLKDPHVLNRLSEVQRVIFDKTGTLTNGTPELVYEDIRVQTKHWLTAAVIRLESQVDHPLASAFTGGLTPRLEVGPAEAVRVVPGAGISGRIDGRHLVLGAVDRLHKLGVDRELCTEIRHSCLHLPEHLTLVIAVLDGTFAAVYGLYDKPRKEAHTTVAKLKEHGLVVSMLSGDRHRAVRACADELAVADAHGDLLPEDKLASLQSRPDTVMMVGDGLNDMGALAQAEVAVTHDEATPAAIRFADVVLAGREIERIAQLFTLADVAGVARNRGYLLSLSYNVVAVSLALAGKIGPLEAALLMPLSSLSLIGLIALILKRRSPWAS